MLLRTDYCFEKLTGAWRGYCDETLVKLDQKELENVLYRVFRYEVQTNKLHD